MSTYYSFIWAWMPMRGVAWSAFPLYERVEYPPRVVRTVNLGFFSLSVVSHPPMVNSPPPRSHERLLCDASSGVVRQDDLVMDAFDGNWLVATEAHVGEPVKAFVGVARPKLKR